MGKVVMIALATLAGTSAQAAVPGGYYTATPKVAVIKTSLVTRSTVWKCADGLCAAPRGNDRDTIACEVFVGRAGAVSSFTAGGVAFTDEALAKCNAKAK